jgi:hypothetical protein
MVDGSVRLGVLAAGLLATLQVGCGSDEPEPTEWCPGATLETQADLAALAEKRCIELNYLDVVGDELETLDGLEHIREITNSVSLEGSFTSFHRGTARAPEDRFLPPWQ